VPTTREPEHLAFTHAEIGYSPWQPVLLRAA
jgi:hypothetical protein